MKIGDMNPQLAEKGIEEMSATALTFETIISICHDRDVTRFSDDGKK